MNIKMIKNLDFTLQVGQKYEITSIFTTLHLDRFNLCIETLNFRIFKVFSMYIFTKNIFVLNSSG